MDLRSRSWRLALSISSEVVSLDPGQISLEGLPRDAFGGYKTGPADDLMAKVAREYRELVHERDTLKETVGVLRRRVDEADLELASFRDQHLRQTPDEIGRALLEAAQRMARDLREEARNDSDAALRKARARARLIEAEARRRYEAVEAARRLGVDVRRRLQATLDAIIEARGDSDTPVGDRI
jgi:cell division septum initiation protein DivIVA